MYDAIVVGARCAGSSTAMLLARGGFKVLLVDEAPALRGTIPDANDGGSRDGAQGARAAMYEFTSQLATLEPPPPEMQALFGALRQKQDATNAFLSAITGAIPLPDFMSQEDIGRIMAASKDAELHA